jgi:N4-(beta-N-acetylglucosaminyl)-L-asparaginase
MHNRRDFFQTLSLLGISLPLMKKFFDHRSPYRHMESTEPMILCSRGHDWAEKVLKPAWQKFKETDNILDAIEAGGNVCELDPSDTSVGYGGLPNENGIVTLDASMMYGPTYKCGSVASMENIKRACSVARLVMERTDHELLVSQGATDFAKAHGFPEENLLTDEARIIWLKWKENLSKDDDWLPPADGKYEKAKRPTGTINVLGMGSHGEIAGTTTTSGLFGKLPGRVGDSPIIGAGLYLDNEVGAAGATGRGEELLRTCGSFLLVEKMRTGMSPQQACEEVVERIIYVNGGRDKIDFNVKMVAFNKNGEVGVAAMMGNDDNLPYASVISKQGLKVVPGKYLIKEENKKK